MRLPDGFRVRLAHGIHTADGGRLLVGGSPLTAMRLSRRAHARLLGGTVTVTDPTSARLAERLLATNLAVPELSRLPAVPELDLTAVIPVRDRPGQLERTLTALRPLHCIVVDDASLDPAAVAKVALRCGADLIPLAVNVGPAGARNAGLAKVTTPYVAFVDSDVEISAADLTRLARHFADPSVSLVGPRVAGIARSPHPAWFQKYDEVNSSLALGTTPAGVRPGSAVSWLPSACLVARTEAVGEGFEAALRVGEDVDLVWRQVEFGHRVRYEPSIQARHDALPTLRGWFGRKFVYGTGGAPLAARHGNKLAPAILTPSYAVAAAALLLRTRWSIPVGLAALAYNTRSLQKVLPNAPGRDAIAARLAVRGLLWAVQQESALLLRHWWPATVVGALATPRVRRAVATALVVDIGLAVHEHQHDDARLATITLIAGRQVDALAYGAGLWWGALKGRSARVLLPRRPTRTRPPVTLAPKP